MFFWLLWPWSIYVGAVGLALCLSILGGLGWLAIIVVPILILFVGAHAAWAGVIMAFATGHGSLGLHLAAVMFGLFVLKMLGAMALTRAMPETTSAPSTVLSTD